MPIARVRTEAEKHVPLDFLQTREISVASRNPIIQHIDNAKSISDDERDAIKAHAEETAKHFRDLLGLKRDEWLLSAGSAIYHESGPDGNEHPEFSALTYRPVIRRSDGKVDRMKHPVLWVDADNRPHGPVTEQDVSFTGQIAAELDMLGYGWYSHRRLPEAETPRDRYLASQIADVVPLWPGIEQETPIEQLPRTGTE